MIQTKLGDICTLIEQFQAIITWQDPRRSTIVMQVCFVLTVAMAILPFRLLLVAFGLVEFTAFFRRKSGQKYKYYSLSEM